MVRRFWVLAALTLLQVQLGGAQALKVYHVAVKGSIGRNLGEILDRAVQSAVREGGVAIILDLQSKGGRIDAAQFATRAIDDLPIPVYALVDARAWGSAALVALSADSIYMTHEASIGAGSAGSGFEQLPLPAFRAIRAEFGARMTARALDRRLGEAMVDQAIAIPDVVRPGERLTLKTAEAVELGVATAGVTGIEQLLARLNLSAAEVVNVGEDWLGTVITIDNHNSRDLRVFFVRSGSRSRFRLGTVTSKNSQTFQVPNRLLVTGAVIEVAVTVIGSSQGITTESIRVEPGLVVQWAIEEHLANSNYFVFVR
ncbi:MAG: hypothetical protein ACE5HT_03045 [Gemmatimonadales bacterium]